MEREVGKHQEKEGGGEWGGVCHALRGGVGGREKQEIVPKVAGDGRVWCEKQGRLCV
jgi:hypothetical protein